MRAPGPRTAVSRSTTPASVGSRPPARVSGRAAALGAVLLACAMLGGCATSPEDDPTLQARLSDLDGRTTKIERVVENQSLLDLSQRDDQLQEEVSVLRGRIEELENANEKLRKQQRDLYADLNRRIAQLSAAGAGAPGAGGQGAAGAAAGPGAPGGAGPGAADADQSAYAVAFDLMKSGMYAQAITAFQQFLASWPKSDLADNAQYWIGEAYYVTRDFKDAGSAFQAVLDRWPDSRKAPDAMLKLGYTQYELKQYPQARATLGAVGTRFPGSDAAKLAADRLSQIPAAAPGGGGQ